jgi:sialate O-acetylesterase
MKGRFIFILISKSFLCAAQFAVSPIFTDNMVIQREKPVVIFGSGKSGEELNITFLNRQKKTTIDHNNQWKVVFPSAIANNTPQKIIISDGITKTELHNILIGDVWLCSGQSNMEWPIQYSQNFKEEIASEEKFPLRFYNPEFIGKNMYGKPYPDSLAQKLYPHSFYEGQWQTSDSSSIATMSAVGYHFGKEIVKQTGVPVGLINLAIGGAPIETFINITELSNHPIFKYKLTKDWLNNEHLPEWIRVRAKENIGNSKTVPQDYLGKNHAFKPGFAFEAGIKPLANFAVKGIIFYQGESNAQEMDRVMEYNKLMKLMIDSYRKLWKNSKLPFYYAQLSSIDTARYKSHFWPEFRDNQRKLMDEVAFTGMAVTSDYGHRTDVHPKNKKVVGERLSRWALAKDYFKKIEYFGPKPLKAEFKNNYVIITFDKNLFLSSGEKVIGFFLIGNKPVEASIRKNSIVIPCDTKPEYIFYGWSPYSEANVTDKAGLPLSTFKIKIK